MFFAYENVAYCVRDILRRLRREILAVVTLQQGFPTKPSAKKRVHNMLNFHVRRVYAPLEIVSSATKILRHHCSSYSMYVP